MGGVFLLKKLIPNLTKGVSDVDIELDEIEIGKERRFGTGSSVGSPVEEVPRSTQPFAPRELVKLNEDNRSESVKRNIMREGFSKTGMMTYDY